MSASPVPSSYDATTLSSLPASVSGALYALVALPAPAALIQWSSFSKSGLLTFGTDHWNVGERESLSGSVRVAVTVESAPDPARIWRRLRVSVGASSTSMTFTVTMTDFDCATSSEPGGRTSVATTITS